MTPNPWAQSPLRSDTLHNQGLLLEAMLISSICTSTGLFCVLSVTDSLAVTGPIGRAISGDPQALIAKTDPDRMRGRLNAFVNRVLPKLKIIPL